MTLPDLQALCGRIRTIFPNAIIGGGACRDAYLGATIKDIDVFVQCDAAVFGQNVDALVEYFGGFVTGTNTYVHAPSYDISVPGMAHPLNVVFRECCPIEDISDYDFGISQIGVSDTEVFKTSAFHQDLLANTLTYTHAKVDKPGWHRQSSANRLERIRAKHSSLLPVDCEALRPFLPYQFIA